MIFIFLIFLVILITFIYSSLVLSSAYSKIEENSSKEQTKNNVD